MAAVADRLAGPKGLVVTPQNGLGVREILEAAVGADRVAAGVTDLGLTLLGPGLVRAFPGRVVLGERAAAEPLADALRTSGVRGRDGPRPAAARLAQAGRELRAQRADALLDLDNGAVLEDPSRRLLVEKAAREVAAVARADGIVLPGDAAEEALAVARPHGRQPLSSMRQDLARQAATEIEFLNGAVAREGRRLGVPTPANTWLASEVRERERAPGRKRRVVRRPPASRTCARGAPPSGQRGPGARPWATCTRATSHWSSARAAGTMPRRGQPLREPDAVRALTRTSPLPRDLERDRACWARPGCDLLFVPGVADMYPPGAGTTVDVGPVTQPLEGERRPGHFRGRRDGRAEAAEHRAAAARVLRAEKDARSSSA